MPIATQSDQAVIIMRSVAHIVPAPENDKLYKPINRKAADFIGLVKSIREHGIQQPIVVDRNGIILSGHRRHAAAKVAKLAKVPVIIKSEVDYYVDRDEFVRLLAEHNRQRTKTIAEAAREAVVLTDLDEAYQALIDHREKKSDLSNFDDAAFKMGAYKARREISAAKVPMMDAIERVLKELRKFWPLSVRQVHYALLNIKPLKHASKPNSTYENDRPSYQDLSSLLTRARLAGLVPWEALADPTRPVTNWKCFQSAGDFLREEVDDFATDYRRDLLQSQPNHIEIVGEKLTVQSIIRPIAGIYRIPMMIGRGYCSIDPLHELAERYRQSGKDKLIVLMLSDFDPDGEQIAGSFAKTLRDDFHIPDVVPIKVAITAAHVATYNLPPSMLAKTTSANHGKFLKAHGKFAYELEALTPDVLQKLLREAIDSVIDVDAFNKEIDLEKSDAQSLQAHRDALLDAMGDVDLD